MPPLPPAEPVVWPENISHDPNAPLPPPIPHVATGGGAVPGLAGLMAATSSLNGNDALQQNGYHVGAPYPVTGPAVPMVAPEPAPAPYETAEATPGAAPGPMPPAAADPLTQPARPTTPPPRSPDLSNLPPAIAASLSRLARSNRTGTDGE
jgi:hypothetical protein